MREWSRPTTRRSRTSKVVSTRRPVRRGNALDDWRTLVTDDDAASFDKELLFDAATLRPAVTWGTNPAMTVTIDDLVPSPDSFADPIEHDGARRALAYMGLQAGTAIRDIEVDTVFIGSCTNSRIEDLHRGGGRRPRPPRAHDGMRALVVPGSMRVKAEAESEGLPKCSWPRDSSGARPAARCASR